MMRKLAAMDAMFLYNETAATPMHVGTLQYLEPRPGHESAFYDDLRQMLLSRIHLVGYLTERVEFPPLGIDHPVWVRHGDFDIDAHLHRVRLPAGADEGTVERLAAELYEPLMDRAKPLWQMWVFEGLADGRVALLQKTHHAAIDGMSSIKAMELLFDFAPEPRVVEPAPADFWETDDPSEAELVAGAYRNLARLYWDGVSRLPKLLGSASLTASRYLTGVRESMPLVAPKTRFNASIDGKRSFAQVSMSLSVAKFAAKAAGVKLNDLMLGICGEGLARYLADHGEAPRAALIANCPVSLHRPGDDAIGNQVSAMNVSMCNDVADIAERLQAIHQSANNAKAAIGDLRESLVMDFGTFGLPALIQQAAQLNANGVAADLAPQPPMNLVVSNVPGFQVPLYVAGAKLLSQMPMSIVVHGGAVNLTVTSYLDRLDLGITAATRRIPDIDHLVLRLQEAYDAFVARVVPDVGEEADELAVAAA